MEIAYLIIFFIVGLHFGSFYTVIGKRLPKNEDFIKTRSHCDICNHNLKLIDMIPIISIIFLKGRCRYCKEKIDATSTFMELFSGILFALAFYIFGFSLELLIAIGIISLLIILSVSDISYYTIPDEVLIFASGYFIIINTLKGGIIFALESILSGLILFGFMYLIMLIGNFFFKKETLGGGDIKLMFVVGLVLNPFLGLMTIFLSSFLALPFSLIILQVKKRKIVPYGPFILLSFMLIYFTGISVEMITSFIRSI